MKVYQALSSVFFAAVHTRGEPGNEASVYMHVREQEGHIMRFIPSQ